MRSASQLVCLPVPHTDIWRVANCDIACRCSVVIVIVGRAMLAGLQSAWLQLEKQKYNYKVLHVQYKRISLNAELSTQIFEAASTTPRQTLRFHCTVCDNAAPCAACK